MSIEMKRVDLDTVLCSHILFYVLWLPHHIFCDYYTFSNTSNKELKFQVSQIVSFLYFIAYNAKSNIYFDKHFVAGPENRKYPDQSLTDTSAQTNQKTGSQSRFQLDSNSLQRSVSFSCKVNSGLLNCD